MGLIENIKRTYNTAAKIVLYVFAYALENEMDEMTQEDVESCLEGAIDAYQDAYEKMHGYDQDMVKCKVNAMLEPFFEGYEQWWTIENENNK